MKSKISPNTFCFQLKVLDYKHRIPAPANTTTLFDNACVEDIVPQLTIFRYAKNHKKAVESGRKKGTVISCQKVDSHIRRLEMTEHLYLEKPIEIVMTPEEFMVGKDLTVEAKDNSIKINTKDLTSG